MGCEKPCESQKSVDISISEKELFGKNFIPSIKSRLSQLGTYGEDVASIVEDYIVVEIYFSSVAEAVTEEFEKVPIFNLIGSVGGQLGTSNYCITRYIAVNIQYTL